MLEQALAYLELGWSVIPVGQNKVPLIQWKKYQTVKPTPQEVKDWWATWPEANIGGVTGLISGVVVIDVDSEEGHTALRRVVSASILDEVPSVVTGGGGKHYYFSHPQNGVISNAVSMLPGVDFRADGGYVVLPPSKHVSGRRYEWENSDKPFRSLPDGVLSINKGKSSGMDWEGEIDLGNRDSELTRRVGKLLQSGLSESDIIPMMITWNNNHCKPPLPVNQIIKIVKSINNREKSKAMVSSNSVVQGFSVHNFIYTLDNFGLQETPWNIKGWLPSSTIGMLVSPPGSYKTWLLMHTAHCVATGGALFGQFKVEEPGPVVIVQQEDPFPLLMSRLCCMMGIGEVKGEDDDWSVPMPPNPPPIYFHTERLLNFKDAKSVSGLRDVVKSLRPKLVIIDPLYSAVGTKDFMAEGAADMLVLKTLRDTYGTSFLIAHHTVKRSGTDTGRENLWGSQFLNAWLETGWQIRKTDDDETSIILRRHFKNSEPVDPVRIKFSIDPYHFNAQLSNNVPKDGGADPHKEALINLIANNKISSHREILKKIPGININTINKVFKEMGVDKDEQGNYCV